VNSADVFPSVEAACPGTTFSNLSGTQQGGVNFDAATVHRDVHLHLAGTMAVSGQCAMAGCAAIQQSLHNTFTSVVCTGTTTCSCDFVYDFTNVDNAAYVISGSRITTDPGTNSEREYDYCVSGSSLTYQEVSQMPAETGVSTMQR
jgi:hypothetical protein